MGMSDTESYRKGLFKACPGFSDFVAVALQDLQLSENDEACTEEREARDSGTIYESTLTGEAFEQLRQIYTAFRRDNAAHIEALTNAHPGDSGFEYLKRPERLTNGGLGSTFWLALVGHGVSFTDDGSHPSLEALDEYARPIYCEGLYFGDDSRVYLMA